MFALTFGNGSPSICDSEEPINLYFLVLTCVLFCLMVVLSFLGFQCFVLDNYSIPAEFAALSYKWFYLEILRSIFSLHYVVYTSRIQIYKLKNINMCRSFARLSPAFCPLLTKEEIYLKKKKRWLRFKHRAPKYHNFLPVVSVPLPGAARSWLDHLPIISLAKFPLDWCCVV